MLLCPWRMNADPRTRLPRLRADTAILCTLVIVAPQLLGGAFPWSVIVIASLAVVALGVALWARRSQPAPVVDAVFLAMAVAWVWTCLQVVPLSSTIGHALSLESTEAAERLRGLAWAGAVPLAVSYEPGSTLLQILAGVSIMAAFLAARLGGPSGLKPIAMATVASAVLLGLVGLFHKAAGMSLLFGVYEPRFVAPRLLTPLMNSNHLGGFSAMGAIIAAGLAARTRGGARPLWISASVLCTVIVAWTLSRGAIGSLLFGFLLLTAWLTGGAQHPKRRRAAVPAAVAGAAVVGIAAFAGLEPILRRFETEGVDKIWTAIRALGLLEGSAWWLGVGRGAFSSAFVSRESPAARVTHPENLIVQWTTEWGVPVAVVLLGIVAWALWKRFRTTDETMNAAVCIAIFALTLQNLVDFSLEMAGVIVVVAALLGALLPASDGEGSRRFSTLGAIALGVFTIALVVVTPRVLRSDTQSIVDELLGALQVDDEAAFVATLRRGLSLRPGEPAFALLAGSYAGIKRRPDAGRWLSIAMDEAPGWAAPHAVAARWLFAGGQTDQALLEIREAEQRHVGRGHDALCEILQRFPRMEYIERGAPSEDRRIAYLNRTARCAELPSSLGAEIDRAILQDEPAHAWAALREARRLTAEERSSDATAVLEQAIEHNADNDRLWVALVDTHVKSGDPEQARLVLQEAMSAGLATRPLLQAQARVQAALGHADAMRATVIRLRGQAHGETGLIASSFILEGDLEASLGNIDDALAAYTAADVANPESPALQYAAALALKSERPTHARRLYRTLCRRTPDGPACAQEARLSKDPSPAPPGRPMP
jgi:tetratricopeptide (TPR) repeat protein